MLTDKNRPEVASIMSSVIPCLHILLKEPGIEQKLAQYAPTQVAKVSTKEAITANIFEILRGNEFANFRMNASKLLKEHALFNERLAHVVLLKPSAEALTQELLKNMKDCDHSFMQELKKLICHQEKKIIDCCEEFIEWLIEVFDDDCDTPPTYKTHQPQAVVPHHSIVPSLQALGEQITHALYPATVINGAKSLLWSFGSGAYHTFESIGSSLTTSKKRKAEGEAVETTNKSKKSKRRRHG